MNPFEAQWVARRYGMARPRVHAKMLEPLGSFLEDALAGRALDLGCGTGLSSVALTSFARQVVGVDVSPEMLGAALTQPSVTYVAARAERLPLASGSVELATLGCAFHWCDAEALFAELARALRPGALLVIYDNIFFGEMRELDSAREWFSSVYAARYPAPARGESFRADLAPHPFKMEGSQFIDEWVPLTLEELVHYLTTQSNVIDAVESGRETLADVESFLHCRLTPLYQSADTSRAHFRFGGLVFVLRHQGAVESGA